MVKKVLEVFKAGKYPQGTYGTKELSEIAVSYDAAGKHEAPLTIGHPKEAAPAWGWVKQVLHVGDKLKIVAEFTDQLADLIKQGLYKKVSVGLYTPTDPTNPTPGKWHLHHVAFLGAEPPAVKGLESVAFTAEAQVVEMAEQDVVSLSMNAKDTYETVQECFASCLAKMQDALESDADDETQRGRMNLALSDCYSEIQGAIEQHYAVVEKVESIKSKMAELRDVVKRLFNSTNHQQESSIMKTEQELAAERQALDAAAAKLEQEKKTFAEEQKAVAAAQRKAVVKQFRDECIAKSLPVNKMDEAGVFTLAERMLDAGVVEFTEGENKTQKSAFEAFKNLIVGFEPVPQGEQKTSDGKPVGFTEADLNLEAAAKHLGLAPGQVVNVEGLAKVAFAQQYSRKHADKCAGETEKEKVAFVLAKMQAKEIAFDLSLLQ